MEQLRAALANWLDPQLIGAVALAWSGRIAAALVIFFVGRILVRVLTEGFRKAVRRVGVEETVSRFLGKVISIVLLVLVALTAVTALGVPTTHFLAILGAAGLALGLALRDSLSNVAAGVMLVFIRPFKVGDSIEAAGVAGTVQDVGIFDTVIKSPDNRVITVPNRLVYGGTIVNSSREPLRRVDLLIPMTYTADVRKAKRAGQRYSQGGGARAARAGGGYRAAGSYARQYDASRARLGKHRRLRKRARPAARAHQERFRRSWHTVDRRRAAVAARCAAGCRADA